LLRAAAQVDSNAAIKILLARTLNPTMVLAGEVDMVSEERRGGRWCNNMTNAMLKNRERTPFRKQRQASKT
jgi:hypothetical protein